MKAPRVALVLALSGLAMPLQAASPAESTPIPDDAIHQEMQKLTPDRAPDQGKEVPPPSPPANPPPAFGAEPRSRPFGSGKGS